MLGALGLLQGCNTDNLVYPDAGGTGRISVAFDWSHSPDAYAEGMRVAFHPLPSSLTGSLPSSSADQLALPDADPGGEVTRFDLPGMSGGDVILAPGRYAVLCYNNDTETIGFDALDDWGCATMHTGASSVSEPMWSTRRAETSASALSQSNLSEYHFYTRSDSTPFHPVEDEEVKKCPDRIWGAAIDTITVAPSYGADLPQTITLTPEKLYCDYTLTIRNVKNLQRAKYMSAVITGMADGINISGGSLSDTRCTHSFPAKRKDADTITSTFRVFGHNTSDTTPHFVELYVITDDGAQYRIHGAKGTQWDVTGQVENAPDPRNVNLVIDGAEIPEGDSRTPSGPGFTPGFDNWQDVHVKIEV